MFEASTADELVDALREVWADGEPWLVLGGGSNLFVGDEPFEGTVVRMLTQGIERMPSPRPGFARLRVQAGHDWDALVAYAVAEGLAGIEAMSGIPGTVGAAPVQNIGAYGQEIVQTLVEVELIDESTGEVSIGAGGRARTRIPHVGAQAPLRLGARSARGHPLGDARARRGRPRRAPDRRASSCAPRSDSRRARRCSVAWVRDHVLATRRRKGMVLDDDDPDTYSAGSFFQNAVVSASFARTLPDECPRWPVTPDLDPVLVIPLAAFDGYVPPPASRRVRREGQRRLAHRASGLRKGFKLPALARRAVVEARARAHEPRQRDGRRARRAGALHPGPRAVGVRPDPAARAGAGGRRAVSSARTACDRAVGRVTASRRRAPPLLLAWMRRAPSAPPAAPASTPRCA